MKDKRAIAFRNQIVDWKGINTMANCDSCVYNVYDDDDECYYCEVDMDEDDAARLMQGHYKECPYYQNDDEYAVVRHQM